MLKLKTFSHNILLTEAWWQSGYAEDCKSLDAGSIPTQASILIMIEKLTLNNFRNHEFGKIQTNGVKNIIITGPNGSGKTAIIEAVSMLGGDKGMRGVAMTDIAKFDGSGGFSVFASLNDDTDISISFSQNDVNRRAKMDGDNVALSVLPSVLRIVWLSPKEDRLFVDSVSDRRAFFDRMVSSFDALHSGRVAKLSKLLSERAGGLKNNADSKLLEIYESQIASTAIAVAAARIKYAGEINYFLENSAVSVNGMVENLILNSDTSDAEKSYLKYLAENRIIQGDKMIIDGAHKSDFGVFNKALNLPASLTSTGQQKSVLIDLILAHCKLIRIKIGKTPIILLDEAVAHLDSKSCERVFCELGKTDAQVWATGLDKSVFEKIENSLFVSCKDGWICHNIKQD